MRRSERRLRTRRSTSCWSGHWQDPHLLRHRAAIHGNGTRASRRTARAWTKPCFAASGLTRRAYAQARQANADGCFNVAGQASRRSGGRGSCWPVDGAPLALRRPSLGKRWVGSCPDPPRFWTSRPLCPSPDPAAHSVGGADRHLVCLPPSDQQVLGADLGPYGLTFRPAEQDLHCPFLRRRTFRSRRNQPPRLRCRVLNKDACFP